MKELAKRMGMPVRKDACKDWIIEAEAGNIHEDGPNGFSVYLVFEHGKSLGAAIRKLTKIGAEARQVGDFELVLYMPKKLALKRSKMLKKLLNPRRQTLKSAA